MVNRIYIKKHYHGSDGRDFQTDFVDYLKEIIESGRWSSMNEGQLALNAVKQVLEELIEELSDITDDV
jgi:hypothetical protein